MIDKQLSSDDERMVALSDVGVPFKDPDLNGSSENILDHREEKRKNARGKSKFSSTVKTPTYLNRNLEDGRLKRRVLKNLKKMGFNHLNSPEVRYIVCPQYADCICGKGCGDFNSSKEKINEMSNRLDFILKKNINRNFFSIYTGDHHFEL